MSSISFLKLSISLFRHLMAALNFYRMIMPFVISVLVSTDYICLIQFEIFLILVWWKPGHFEYYAVTFWFYSIFSRLVSLTVLIRGKVWLPPSCRNGWKVTLPTWPPAHWHQEEGPSRRPSAPLPRLPLGLSQVAGEPRSEHVFLPHPIQLPLPSPQGVQEGSPSLCPPRGCGDTVVC